MCNDIWIRYVYRAKGWPFPAGGHRSQIDRYRERASLS